MINHMRTLLLNVSGAVQAATSGWEEYIDPSFSPLKIPGNLNEVYECIMPSGLSRTSKTCRAYSIMRMLHAPDFERYVLLPDPRITYDITKSPYLPYGAQAESFSIPSIYSALMARSGQWLFSSAESKAKVMLELRDIWNGGYTLKDKFSAGVIAVLYSIDEVRING